MWLRDSLPKDAPTVRIILYGYESRLEQDSLASIHGYGHDFRLAINMLQANSNVRSYVCFQSDFHVTDELQGPRRLIFIAHSFGGLILKAALTQTSNLRSHETSSTLLENVSGILNFGVPNLGMSIDHLLPLVRGKAKADLIISLRTGSEELQRLDADFEFVMESTHIHLVAFFELMDVTTAEKVELTKTTCRVHLSLG